MLVLLATALAGDATDQPTPPETAPVAGRLEFSFGSSLLIREQALLGQDITRIVPVPSVLMLGEFLVRPQLSVASFVNIPTGTAKELQPDGSVVEHHAAAAVALGAGWAPFVLPVSERAWFKPQVAAFGGAAIRSTKGTVVFPMVAAKLNIVTVDGFTMYGGASFAFSQNTLAILYGAGHRF